MSHAMQAREGGENSSFCVHTVVTLGKDTPHVQGWLGKGEGHGFDAQQVPTHGPDMIDVIDARVQATDESHPHPSPPHAMQAADQSTSHV